MEQRTARRKILVNARSLWQLMDLHSMSQNELARFLGLSQGYLSQLTTERGVPRPRRGGVCCGPSTGSSPTCSSWCATMNSGRQLMLISTLRPGAAYIPEDFPSRLDRLRRWTGLS